jgi:hypothetical protein
VCRGCACVAVATRNAVCVRGVRVCNGCVCAQCGRNATATCFARAVSWLCTGCAHAGACCWRGTTKHYLVRRGVQHRCGPLTRRRRRLLGDERVHTGGM